MKSKILIFSLLAGFGIAAVAGYMMYSKNASTRSQAENALSSTPPDPEEKLITFEEDGFALTYPNWTKINYDTAVADADKIRVAVSGREGCSFFLKIKELPEGQTLQEYTDQVKKNMGDRLTVTSNDVKENEASLDGEVKMSGDVTMRNVSRVFKKGNKLFSLAFIAEKNAFSNSCTSVMNEVISSVKLK